MLVWTAQEFQSGGAHERHPGHVQIDPADVGRQLGRRTGQGLRAAVHQLPACGERRPVGHRVRADVDAERAGRGVPPS
ncbi:hypothetical protein [Streptomyces sp. 6-11-2]|uniref:hypothetical protein n=1 Tax=Streptomyces sp. 6-11-2 TaxID=2585753 RepID=UPI00280A8641|nr:hypothetical protein [Streptomyces sp. 6-11-2]